jgi:hypothetical protein
VASRASRAACSVVEGVALSAESRGRGCRSGP